MRCEDVFFIVRGEEKYTDDHRLRDMGREMIREYMFNISNMGCQIFDKKKSFYLVT